MINREIRLKNRPKGLPTLDAFELVETSIPKISDGEFLVRNHWMSVDPYMRGRMIDRKSYAAPFAVGEVLRGASVGQIIESRNADYKAGEFVHGQSGWRDYWSSTGKEVYKIDPQVAPIQTYLGALGMTGLTAYVGLFEIAKLKPGETVFVSGAAGAVGSIVCQIAKLLGCYVVGSAGADDKIEWLKTHAKVDAAINYKKTEDLPKEVAKLFPRGIDVYFENVGGKHLDAALLNMARHGRIAVCGLISIYNNTAPEPGPSAIARIIASRSRIEGFLVIDYPHLREEFFLAMASWVREQKITWHETIVDGLEHAPQAFIDLFHGKNLGKMLVKLS